MAYTAPTVADLVTRYPVFAAVPISTVEIYLSDAAAGADETWQEADYVPAICALAAHNMALVGLAAQTEAEKYSAQGIRSVRSGSFSVDISDSVVARNSAGGLQSTLYGRLYLTLLKRNRGGPRVVAPPVCADAYGDFGGICNNGLTP